MGRANDIKRLIKQAKLNDLPNDLLEKLKTKLLNDGSISSSGEQLNKLVSLHKKAYFREALELGQTLKKDPLKI